MGFTLEGHGIAASVFLALFIILAPFAAYCIYKQGRTFIPIGLFVLLRIGGCITGIIVASMSLSNVNIGAIVAEAVLSSIGTFWFTRLVWRFTTL
jgi:hypothetical protein